ncbi:hypothetical protein J6590_026544 [Homalodisca vitripennis]|nr:hypothetical protein J6590_026544 [Homalodisca vitripennis]
MQMIYHKTYTKLVLYADNTTAIIKEKNLHVMKLLVEQTIVKLEKWFKVNGIILNATKTNIIHFKNRQQKEDMFTVTLDNEQINSCKYVKLLEVCLDEHMI